MIPIEDREDYVQDALIKMIETGCLDNGVPATKNKSYAGRVAKTMVADYYRERKKELPIEMAETITDGNEVENGLDVSLRADQVMKEIWPRLTDTERWAVAAYVRGIPVGQQLALNFRVALCKIRARSKTGEYVNNIKRKCSVCETPYPNRKRLSAHGWKVLQIRVSHGRKKIELQASLTVCPDCVKQPKKMNLALAMLTNDASARLSNGEVNA